MEVSGTAIASSTQFRTLSELFLFLNYGRLFIAAVQRPCAPVPAGKAGGVTSTSRRYPGALPDLG